MAHHLVLGVVEAAHLMPMVALKEVRVYIECNRNTTMTECLLDILRIRSLLDQKARIVCLRS